MRGRAQAIGGDLVIDSGPGGTTLSLDFPTGAA